PKGRAQRLLSRRRRDRLRSLRCSVLEPWRKTGRSARRGQALLGKIVVSCSGLPKSPNSKTHLFHPQAGIDFRRIRSHDCLVTRSDCRGRIYVHFQYGLRVCPAHLTYSFKEHVMTMISSTNSLRMATTIILVLSLTHLSLGY